MKAPESPLSSETVSFPTPFVAPKAVGAPRTPFVRSSSAVMVGELDPENASTEYFFEYAQARAPGEEPLAGCVTALDAKNGACPGVMTTAITRSAVYAKLGVTVEASGLQPATPTTIAWRRSAKTAKKPCKTKPSVPRQLHDHRLGARECGNGLGERDRAHERGRVRHADPDGQPATYAFELGVYNATETQYGVVFSGPTGPGTTPVQEELALTGLQPGTTYAYRILVKSGYGTATGAPVTFTTTGLPEVLLSPASLALLAIPSVVFPAPVISTGKAKVAPKKAKKKAKKKLKKGKGQKAKKARKSTNQKTQR